MYALYVTLCRKVIGNGVLLLDKPLTWSATDCVMAVKNALKAKKVGHVGALDTNATGLVILLLGERGVVGLGLRGIKEGKGEGLCG